MKKLFFILFSVALISPAFGQQNLEGRSIDRGKIYTTNADTVEGQYIVFLKDSIEYYLENYKTRHTIGLDQVSKVEEYNGNYGNTGIWIGAISGAAIGLAVALGTKETETKGIIQTTTIQTWPIYLFTGLGTLLGYVIGINIDDWNTVYSKSLAFLKNLNLKQNRYTGVSLSYRLHF